MPGVFKKVAQLLIDAPEIVEANHITGEDCFLAKVAVRNLQELESVVDRLSPFSATDKAIIRSPTIAKRLLKL